MTEIDAQFTLSTFTVKDGALRTFPEQVVSNRVIPAMKTAGRFLKLARLATGPLFLDGEPAAQLTRLIATLPQCETLELQYDTATKNHIQYTLEALEEFQDRNLQPYNPQTDPHKRVPCMGPDPVRVEALGTGLGQNLVSLRLADLDWSLQMYQEECEGPFRLKALRCLALCTEFFGDFLDAFEASPLEHVVLARESHAGSFGISVPFVFKPGRHIQHGVTSIFSLTAQHSTTLQSVWVHQDHLTSGHGQLEPCPRQRGLAGGLYTGEAPEFTGPGRSPVYPPELSHTDGEGRCSLQ